MPRKVQRIHRTEILMLLIAINYIASMLSSSSDDSGDKRWWKIWEENTGEAMAREECKVLNWYVFSQFRFLRLDDWNQIHFGRHILLAISAPLCLFVEIQSVLETKHSGGCDCFLGMRRHRTLAISILQLDDWNQIHFGRDIWLAFSAPSCLLVEI